MTIGRLKLPFSQLALMKWLTEKPGRFIASLSSLRASRSSFYYESRETGEDGKLQSFRVYPVDDKDKNVEFLKSIGGREAIDTSSLYRAGLITTHSNLMSSPFSKNFFNKVSMPLLATGEVIYLPTKNMRNYWETYGRVDYEEELAKLQKREAEVRRTIVVGKKALFTPTIPKELMANWPEGIALPVRKIKKVRPFLKATVVKETATRLYVENVTQTGRFSTYEVLRGSPPNQYVEKSDVIADYADDELIGRLLELDREFDSDIEKISVETIQAALPYIQNTDSRFKQKEAEHEDMMRDILESNDKAPKP